MVKIKNRQQTNRNTVRALIAALCILTWDGLQLQGAAAANEANGEDGLQLQRAAAANKANTEEKRLACLTKIIEETGCTQMMDKCVKFLKTLEPAIQGLQAAQDQLDENQTPKAGMSADRRKLLTDTSSCAQQFETQLKRGYKAPLSTVLSIKQYRDLVGLNN